jgi:hypothetical protein
MSATFAIFHAAPHARPRRDCRIGQPRPVDFRTLVGRAAWFQLPAAVRRRFETGAHGEASVFYPGVMQVRASVLGWLIANVCRLIGTPLAPVTGDAVPVTVEVRGDGCGGMEWLRTYHFAGRAPVEVGSCKRADVDGSLLEIVRGGIGMRLAVTVEDQALHFRSTAYFLELRGVRVPLPLWLTPGAAHVIHTDQGGGVFRFTLRFVHPLAGETFFRLASSAIRSKRRGHDPGAHASHRPGRVRRAGHPLAS